MLRPWHHRPVLLGPRVVIAGTHSGVGKTILASGLIRALVRRGLRVGAAKVGPDYIDPGFHAVAAGRPGRNLDPWLCGSDVVAPLAARAGAGRDVLVIEGVMGLFDGATDGGPASTADVARLLDAPVVLVVDARAMSGSVAALVRGFSTHDPSVPVAGVILNRVGSDDHEELLRAALQPLGTPVLGVVRRHDDLVWPDRHLGLVPVAERRAEVGRLIDRVAVAVERDCDLNGLVCLARSATARDVGAPPTARPTGRAVRLAVAAGPAFAFCYPDNLELLTEAGAELLPFDPLCDPALPEGATGLYLGGGFPEVFAEALAANRPLLFAVAAAIDAGLVTWAECGGLLWLTRSLDGRPMAGVLASHARMTDRLTLGYRTAAVRIANPLAAVGEQLRGHEFHYSTTDPAGDALELTGGLGHARTGSRDGWATPTLLATYLHQHLGGAPHLATRFVASAGRSSAR